ANDIDLFGLGSFFQYVNRTVTEAGERYLVSLLKANDTCEVVSKQEAIRELSQKTEWRQQFSMKASRVKTEVSPETILQWMCSYQSIFVSSFGIFSKCFSGVSILLIAGLLTGYVSFSYLLLWYFLGLFISGAYVKKVTKLQHKAGKSSTTFEQYYKSLEVLEKMHFSSELLHQKHAMLYKDGIAVSKLFKELSKALDALDQRYNLLFAFFANGLFLWDIQQSVKIEKWISLYKDEVANWFSVLSFFDAYNSLGNFSFNHPDFKCPKISQEEVVFQAKDLGHPLLNASKRVTSDFSIDRQGFFVVTGANMAGKSTFLRTVSLTIVMANLGLPVCSTDMRYHPVKLLTSMRTSDSLMEDASYFFAELKRLKFIVDQLQKSNYFIVLDEILKGTNSTDKAIGSKKFVEKLLKTKATGVIATHDLSLCEIESNYPQVENYYFDATIADDELYFDYKLKKGVCQNMNASYLLRKMEIV
ncbi:MAG: MutS-related protein, partial [Flavicella sp.]